MKKLSLRSGLMATTTLLSSMAIPALVASVAVLTPSMASAQDYTSGAITVSVTDSNNAPVAGATITLTSKSQGISKTITSNASGSATATGLAAGEYTVMVSASGYDTYKDSATIVVSQEVKYSYAMHTVGAQATTVVVKGKRARQDFTKTTSGLSVDLTTLTSQQAIGRSIEAVTLLAPTAQNSTAFGEPSIGGGSAAENAFYINGLNVTNPDTYVGLATIPFDFYKTIDVQTSGTPAEFGRATGGVVNATTKSGTNTFMLGVHGNFAPQSLASQTFASPITTSPLKYRKSDADSLTLEAGGAIIKDKLFLYAMAALQDTKSQFASTSGKYFEKDKNTSPFYGLKGDWYITPGQHLELTYFDTTATTHQTRYSYNCPTATNLVAACANGPSGQVNEVIGTTGHGAKTITGGPSWVAKYTASITDWFSASVEYGDSKYKNDFTSNDTSTPYVALYSSKCSCYSPNTAQFYSAATTVDDWERKFTRLDGDIRFEKWGRHHIRFGYDQEDLSMTKTTKLPGAYPIRYYLLPEFDYGYIIYENLGGKVSSKDSAYYIQDAWDVTSTLNLQIGLRNDDFQAKNLSGQRFLSLTGNVAPRLGLSWKPSEDSKWRFTAYYGQEYIPPAMNLGFRGKDLYFAQYFYTPTGGYSYNADGTPKDMGTAWTGVGNCPALGLAAEAGAAGNLTSGTTNCAVFGNGTQEPAAAKAAVGLKATRSTEITLGAYYTINDLWSVDLIVQHRSLDRVSEDTDFAPQINAYCASKGMTCSFSNEYHVWNVGDSVTIHTFDTLPDGETTITLNNLGFPKPKRNYDAATIDFKREFDGKWGLQGSYTYSRLIGNYEGTVLSTGSGSGQYDAGSTMLYDYVHLSDYSSGRLINDHPHQFKVWGSYAPTPDITIGAVVNVASPSPLSCLGHYPDSTDAAYAYGSNSHYCLDTSKVVQSTTNASGVVTNFYGFVGSPMGKALHTDWTKTVDLSLRYRIPHNLGWGGKLVLRADIFNLFNDKEATALTATSDSVMRCGYVEKNDWTGGTKHTTVVGSKTACLATPNVNYSIPTAYYNSRYMRVGFDLTF